MVKNDPNLIHVPEELFETAESRHFEGETVLDELVAGPDAYRFAAPVAWSVAVTNTGDALLVMGTARAQAACGCARCLEEVAYDLEGDIEGYFIIGGTEAAAPDDLEGDEFSYLPDNHVIDMVPLIVSALLLELPLVPLCDDECKGLCPQCGANLNEGPCACASDGGAAAGGPFAALKDFDFGA